MSDYIDTLPDEFEVCPKCKTHILIAWNVYPEGYCFRCGYKGPGIRCRRAEPPPSKEELLDDWECDPQRPTNG